MHDAFQPTFTSFFLSCYRAELAILEAISVGLGLPRQTLGQLHSEQSNELRLTHYPAVPRGEFSHSTRIAAHTDFGTITLLFQDDVGGLRKNYVQFFFSVGANLPHFPCAFFAYASLNEETANVFPRNGAAVQW